MSLRRQPVIVVGVATAAALLTAGWMQRLDARPVPAGDAAAHKAADGHFWAEAEIDGRSVRLMVDTGASFVALTPADAARLGVLPPPTAYVQRLRTASGETRAAPVRLARVAVGDAVIENVEALVVPEGLPHSLLGMSYLGRLSAFEAREGALVLRP
ncbi:MAG TPA: TIGR02281 family clan AA aspartic protease [Brevundimonas sp.]|jgi:aspartyl protease family protein|uniref:TIGR02281 family clan AA aspartic protease n=1 Tax=Brevundimonas sp. TaxID=1871086 RepID=UPI002E0FEC54|nr:TIGR02281 family clan AA aspartic protease [Brevundimonas sp.]